MSGVSLNQRSHNRFFLRPSNLLRQIHGEPAEAEVPATIPGETAATPKILLVRLKRRAVDSRKKNDPVWPVRPVVLYWLILEAAEGVSRNRPLIGVVEKRTQGRANHRGRRPESRQLPPVNQGKRLTRVPRRSTMHCADSSKNLVRMSSEAVLSLCRLQA